MPGKTPRIALTPGEPAGIGPDLCLLLAQQEQTAELVTICDPELLQQRALQLGLPFRFHLFDPARTAQQMTAGELCILPVRMKVPAQSGVLDTRNARYVLDTLDAAIDGCQSGQFDALVTGPLHKGNINDAGIPFCGHTEYLAAATRTEDVVMLLATNSLRVALVTTHIPLSQVSSHITSDRLQRIIRVLHTSLQSRFRIDQPRIRVCGLNPHAGEGGHLGREEIDVIIPTLQGLRDEGISLEGPLPADTVFNKSSLKGCDAILAMYHDQGLPVLKHSSFGRAVNITLGLPIIRTSVDHGTAVDLAGTGNVDTGSLQMAIYSAISQCSTD
ncbi:MAG: 4-hydroxythreonine-4-phosphate dehydrogenase PdxA [Pseudomonadota bacterium]